VERFLKGREPGAIGLDVGCGNGKYLAINPDVFIVASDRYALAEASNRLGEETCLSRGRPADIVDQTDCEHC
jgi:hypothetical protein